jgi:4-alpha-glucanotransferase
MTANDPVRHSGVWLHLTALPGKRGCGTLGPEAFDFANKLAQAGQTVWQILPLHPVRSIFNHSPYSPASCFAGNPLLIDEAALVAEYHLPDDGLASFPDTRGLDHCRWAERWDALKNLLWQIFDRIEADLPNRDDFQVFCREAAGWLDDYAIFEGIVDELKSSDWRSWPLDLRRRDDKALNEFKATHAREIAWHRWVQFIFFTQWQNLRLHCNNLGIRLLGDMPLYGQFDSADIWAHPDVYEIDPATLQPTAVAGVPPDYFSEDGQLWGNPLYHWFEGDGLHGPTVTWWRQRLTWALKQTNLVRIDHFRGLEAFWSIPASARTAKEGTWRKGPDIALFEALKDILGEKPPLVAEDLGIITPEVERLRDRLGLPGMKIMHFAFGGGDDHPYLPHNLEDRPWVLYLGTHDNTTTLAWLSDELRPAELQRVEDYVAWSHEGSLVWRLIETAAASRAGLVLFSVTDLLEYGREARFNVPGQAVGNWSWKLSGQDLSPVLNRLGEICRRHRRI